MNLALPQSALATARPGRTTRLLVVEDEPVLREMFAEVLGSEGCVDTAEDGLDALARLEERSYDLILTEVNLPRLGGLDLFDYVAATRPELTRAFVFMSSGLSDESARFFESRGVWTLLRKPITVAALLDAVRTRLADSWAAEQPARDSRVSTF